MRNVNDSILWRLLDGSAAEWIGFAGAIVVVVVLICVIFRVRSWFREDEGPAAWSHEMLLQFRDLHREGDLTDTEFRSIKSRLLNEEEVSRKANTGTRQAQPARDD